VTVDWAIRPEQLGDEAAISAVTKAAFAGQPHSDGSEVAVVEGLRAACALSLSLVAEAQGEIVGHVAFSPVTIPDGTRGWFGLGPVSVEPARQREGIGGALVRAGLEQLHDLEATGCVVLGDPAYYGRFGYAHDPALTYPVPMPEAFQQQRFSGPAPKGEVSYHSAFG
jgi:putative acetyltransferase